MTITSNRYTSAIVFILTIAICGTALLTSQSTFAQTETNQNREELIAQLKTQIEEVRERIEKLQNQIENRESNINRLFAPQFPAAVAKRLENTTSSVSGGLRVNARRVVIEQTYQHPETGVLISREELENYLQVKIAETQVKIQNALAKRMESQPVQSTSTFTSTEQIDRDQLLLDIRAKIEKVEADIATLVEQKMVMSQKAQSKARMIRIAEDDAAFLAESNTSKEKKYPKGQVPAIVLFVLVLIIILLILTPSIKRWKENRKKQNTFNP